MSTDKELEALALEAEQEAERMQVAPPGAPMRNARWFIVRRYKECDRELLVCQGGAFYAYNGMCWPLLEDAELRSQVYKDFEHAVYLTKAKAADSAPFNPTQSKVENIIGALKGITFSDSNSTVPKWLDGRESPQANEIVVCQNGLINVTTRELMPHTSLFFQHHAVPFNFDPEAPTPCRWKKFLRELFPGDKEAVKTLQEWMGYLVSADTRQQKMLLIHGPKRSGKGTIGRILGAMLGSQNIVGPTLASLGQNFGLAPLIGKPVAIVSDARAALGNGSLITERLLSISGEDPQTVDRKNKEAWTVMFPTRIVILTNELPRLNDSSGALASRFIVLTLRKSFYQNPDITLTDKLKTELPGIFNWTLEGLARLSERGHFVQPGSGADAAEQLGNLSSPIATFVDECCEVAPDKQVPKDELFVIWKEWCDRNGHMSGSKSGFANALYAAFPAIRHSKLGNQDKRVAHFAGVRISCVKF